MCLGAIVDALHQGCHLTEEERTHKVVVVPRENVVPFECLDSAIKREP